MTMLAIKGLYAGYGKVAVLHGVNLAVNRGHIVTLIGANGAGKTTLLKTISGLLRPSAGSIEFQGENIAGRPAHKVTALGISQVVEGRAILRRMTVVENLRMGAFVRNDSDVEPDIEAMFQRFPVLRERQDRLAGVLSGGEQQMLVIARALMARPRLLLLDEPSLGLAPIIVTQIFRTLRDLKEEGKTIFLVEQNARQALQIADEAYLLERGVIALEGTGQKFLDNPEIQHNYLGRYAA